MIAKGMEGGGMSVGACPMVTSLYLATRGSEFDSWVVHPQEYRLG